MYPFPRTLDKIKMQSKIKVGEGCRIVLLDRRKYGLPICFRMVDQQLERLAPRLVYLFPARFFVPITKMETHVPDQPLPIIGRNRLFEIIY